MPKDRAPSAASCSAGPLQRGAAGVAAVVLTGLAISSIADDPVVAFIAGVFAVMAVVMAATGRCAIDWLASRTQSSMPKNTMGFPEARAVVVRADRTVGRPDAGGEIR